MATFKPGQSGNISGRPKGRPNKNTQLVKLLEANSESLVNKVIELALSGDPISLRLCIERLIPKVKDKSAAIIMPDLSTIEVKKAIPEMLNSLAGQEISIPELKGLIDIIQTHDDTKKQPVMSLKLNTKDPNEAARIYAEIMKGGGNSPV
ncbi:MAG: DUF5681 domain-containing protein [Legionella sp.]|uniref:DUF5681 domain-containing protein n=1 Tax=Legionella sp. TaxID=459 RepID=UPI0028424519|nr:DUF5681 domain-containing protein [Legionella sp.]